MMGAAAPPPAPPDDQPEDLDSIIAQIKELVALVIQDGGVTAKERLDAEKINTILEGMRAGWEKEKQAALGGGPATQFISRAVRGA